MNMTTLIRRANKSLKAARKSGVDVAGALKRYKNTLSVARGSGVSRSAAARKGWATRRGGGSRRRTR